MRRQARAAGSDPCGRAQGWQRPGAARKPRIKPPLSRADILFLAQTGVPLVINTSFNDSEPIVCTPTDAIVTFRKSGIDALFMDDVYLTAQS